MARPAKQRTETQFWAFVSDSRIKAPGWQRKPLLDNDGLSRNDLINRYYKILHNQIGLDADISIYIDGNVEIIASLDHLIKEFVDSGASIGLSMHPQRKTIVEEAGALKKLKKFKADDESRCEEQLKEILDAGFPVEFGLFAGGVIFRRHDCWQLNSAMEEWWSTVNRFTARDQLSLPYIIWRHQLQLHRFYFNILEPNEWFVRKTHWAPFWKKSASFLKAIVKRRLCR